MAVHNVAVDYPDGTVVNWPAEHVRPVEQP